MSNLIIIIVFLLIGEQTELTIAINSIVYKKDVSEHCRRRVISSVFLGRRIVDANSRVLYFTRLDQPYSCLINVRTELGNEIVLVIEVSQSREKILKSCSEGKKQIVVYELDEIYNDNQDISLKELYFKNILNQERLYTRRTTIATTTPIQINTDAEESDVTQLLSMQENKSSDGSQTSQKDYITIEVPLVNISARIDNDDADMKNAFDVANFFSKLYNVTSKPEEIEYDTKILPLVEVYINQSNGQQDDKEEDDKLYEMDINLNRFLPNRIKLPNYHGHQMKTRKPYRKYKWNANKPMKTNKNRHFFDVSEIHDYRKQSTERWMRYSTHRYRKTEDLITKLPLKSIFVQKQILPSNVSKVSNDDIINNTFRENSSAFDDNFNSLKNKSNIKYYIVTERPDIRETETNDDTLELKSKLAFRGKKKINNTEPVSMVDHESFENIVKVAPVMASLLNDTRLHDNVNETIKYINYDVNNITGIAENNVSRDKRDIHVVTETNAFRFYNIVTLGTTPFASISYHAMNARESANFAELLDDEIHSRVAISGTNKSTRPILFDICKHTDFPKFRHVFVVNSSRIIIAIENFTLEELTVVATSARTLNKQDDQCLPQTLECQVFGTRVCIDSISACDGIPNCGVFDIYDEDRLMCGHDSLQHNVFLAGCTFLIVLFILLYAVYYWIKRCVPQVSKAFFIHTTDAARLNLNSIMHSFTNIDYTKMIYVPEYNFNSEFDSSSKKKSFKTRLLNFFRNVFNKNREKENSIVNDVPQLTYSYAQSEIRKMIEYGERTTQTIAQHSFEMLNKTEDRVNKSATFEQLLTVDKDMSDLNIIKFLRDSKDEVASPKSMETVIRNFEDTHDDDEEEELRNTVLEPAATSIVESDINAHLSVQSDIHSIPSPEHSKHIRKQLRFEEQSVDIDEAECSKKQIDSHRHWYSNLEKIEVDNQANNSGREGLRFWGNKKGRKTKRQ